MSCGLSIIGVKLDIDTFVKKSQIDGFKKSYKGEPINAVNSRVSKYSFVSIVTSDADFNDIIGQINDTLMFLEKYRENLKHIATTEGIDYATINFGVDSTISEDSLTQNFYFPIELVKICGELGIGIELSIYKEDMQVILERKYG